MNKKFSTLVARSLQMLLMFLNIKAMWKNYRLEIAVICIN